MVSGASMLSFDSCHSTVKTWKPFPTFRSAHPIADAEKKLSEQVHPPQGYHYEWAGEFQELQAAVARLEIVVPVSLLIIFFLLYSAFGNLRDAFLLLGTVPLALIGGMLSLLVTHTNFSIAAAVGFISLLASRY